MSSADTISLETVQNASLDQVEGWLETDKEDLMRAIEQVADPIRREILEGWVALLEVDETALEELDRD